MVQNEINNLGFLTGEGKAKMSKVNIIDISCDMGDEYQHIEDSKENIDKEKLLVCFGISLISSSRD